MTRKAQCARQKHLSIKCFVFLLQGQTGGEVKMCFTKEMHSAFVLHNKSKHRCNTVLKAHQFWTVESYYYKTLLMITPYSLPVLQLQRGNEDR